MSKVSFETGMNLEQLNAVRLVSLYCEDRLPDGWRVRLELGKPKSKYLLITPDNKTIDPSMIDWFPWKNDLPAFANLVRFAVFLHETDQ